MDLDGHNYKEMGKSQILDKEQLIKHNNGTVHMQLHV